MEKISYYRDQNLPVFEIKSCNGTVHSSREHYHEEFSVGFVEKGTSEVNCCGKAYQVGAPTAILILPEVIHKCTPRKVKEWCFNMLYLKRAWTEAVFGPRLNNRAFLVKSLKAGDVFQVSNLLQKLQGGCSSMEKETRLITGLDYLFELSSCFDEQLRSHFHKAFKQYFGMAPAGYAKTKGSIS